jgi:hypothetical protein
MLLLEYEVNPQLNWVPKYLETGVHNSGEIRMALLDLVSQQDDNGVVLGWQKRKKQIKIIREYLWLSQKKWKFPSNNESVAMNCTGKRFFWK